MTANFWSFAVWICWKSCPEVEFKPNLSVIRGSLPWSRGAKPVTTDQVPKGSRHGLIESRMAHPFHSRRVTHDPLRSGVPVFLLAWPAPSSGTWHAWSQNSFQVHNSFKNSSCLSIFFLASSQSLTLTGSSLVSTRHTDGVSPNPP
jgi:hypothetical protein